jgi:gas vesicle protein
LDDRSRVLLGACLGAIAGSVAGYLFLTADGRRLRERLEPGAEDLLREIRNLRGTVERAKLVAKEGYMAVEDLRNVARERPLAGWARTASHGPSE